MTTTVNLHEVYLQYKEEDELLVVDEGTYDLEVISCTVKGGNSLLPTFKVLTGPYASRRLLAGQFTLSDKSRSIFFQNLKGFGLDELFWAQSPSFEQIAAALVGRQVTVFLVKRDWQGSDRNSIPIGKIRLIGGAAAAAPAAAAVAAPPPPAAVAPVTDVAAPPVAVAPVAAPPPPPAAVAPAAVVADGDPPF